MNKRLSNVASWLNVILSIVGFCLTEGYAAQRGRPVLNAAGTTFVADNGQLLRGPFTSSEWGSPAPYQEIANMKNYGFNSVHIYGECFDKNYPNPGSTAPGYAASRIDSVVQATRSLGMYVVLTIGNGANNGDYNRQYVVDFWDFYAERYADETHVVFEIQNEPVAWGPPYSDSGATPPGAVEMEVEVYQTIRSHAPDTPVLIFSYAVLGGIGGASNALKDIEAFNRALGGRTNNIWNKTAIGFHGYAGWTSTAEAVEALLDAGYPCFMTEFGSGSWGVNGGGFDVHLASELERLQVSWMAFQYIPPWGVSDDVTQPKSYKERVEKAGMSWTPDYGTWPLARSAFSDDGLPWTTIDTWINNRLVGTLRLEAEDFDWGGQGVAYSDEDPENWGGHYRPEEGVDIIDCNDQDPGYAVTDMADGEWLEYTLYVPEPGFYNLSLRVACPNDQSAVRVICYDLDKTGEWTIPYTGSGRTLTWTTITKKVFLEFGRQRLHLEILTGGFYLNWIELSPSQDIPIANGIYKLVNQNSGMVIKNNTSNHQVEQSVYSGSNTQKWKLHYLGAGQYRVQSAHDNYYWNTWSNTMTWWWGIDSQGQRFIVRPVEEGYYSILPVDSGKSYGIEDASLSPGAQIDQDEYVGLAHQKWAILSPSAPAFPTQMDGEWVAVDQVDLTWSASVDAISYNLKRSMTSGGPYTTIAVDIATHSYSDIGVDMDITYYYVVTANTAKGESLHSAEFRVSIPVTMATGSIIGTNGSWSNDPTRTKEAAMDGNTNTFYDATTGTGHWVGLDFGNDTAFVITEIRYVPRSGYSGRMVGAKIQGSNTANFSSGVIDLFTITDQPNEGIYTTQTINDHNAYRYVRYLSAPNGYCNVAEIEFYREGLSNDSDPGSEPVELHAHLDFDERSGTAVYDDTGNGWTSTLINGAIRTTGIIGKAVDLDGNDDYVSLPSGIVDGMSAITITAWVNLDTLSTWSRIFDFGSGTTENMFLTPRSASGSVRFAITQSGAGSEQQINGSEALPSGEWAHVAVTLSGSTGILYVDGSEIGRNNAMSLTPSSLGNMNNNYIGKSQYADPYLDGLVDDFRIYSGVLTSSALIELSGP